MTLKNYVKTFFTPYASASDFYHDFKRLFKPFKRILNLLLIAVSLPIIIGLLLTKGKIKDLMIWDMKLNDAANSLKDLLIIPTLPFRWLIRGALTPFLDSPKIEYTEKMQELKRAGKQAIKKGDIVKAKEIRNSLRGKLHLYQNRGQKTDIKNEAFFYFYNDANVGNYFTLFSKKPNKFEILRANFQDKVAIHEAMDNSDHQKWNDDFDARTLTRRSINN
jgi:hypothetical protein